MRVQVGDEESREQLIKDHYMARVGELTSQLQLSDSKAVHFHAEVSQAPAPSCRSVSVRCASSGGAVTPCLHCCHSSHRPPWKQSQIGSQ